MWNAVRQQFTAEKELNGHFDALRSASQEVVEAKHRLDEAIADKHNEDQFRIFAESARKSQF